MRLYQSIFFIGVAFLLTACGGGGGGKSNEPPITPPLSSTAASSISSVATLSSSSSSVMSSKASLSSNSVSSSSSSSLTSSSATSVSASSIPFRLTSTSFVADSSIPIKYSCYGTEISPQLKWDITSNAIKSFTLIMEDLDAIAIVGHPYVHWDIYNIPSSAREISEGATTRSMPVGSIEGANDDNVPKYSGPCPPVGSGLHHYYFALYALNKDSIVVDAGHAMMRSQFEKNYADAIIQKVEIIGLFTR